MKLMLPRNKQKRFVKERNLVVVVIVVVVVVIVGVGAGGDKGLNDDNASNNNMDNNIPTICNKFFAKFPYLSPSR